MWAREGICLKLTGNTVYVKHYCHELFNTRSLAVTSHMGVLIIREHIVLMGPCKNYNVVFNTTLYHDIPMVDSLWSFDV